jgi:acylphosphatase
MRPTTGNERRLVLYSGRVQGVGFRYTTHTIARRHGVSGYVRNLPDGRVELAVEGSRQEVEAFLLEVRDHFSGHIRDERSDVQPATSEFSGFEVRH